jgi:hypothetical protein
MKRIFDGSKPVSLANLLIPRTCVSGGQGRDRTADASLFRDAPPILPSSDESM